MHDMGIKAIAAHIELLQGRIDDKHEAAARLRDKLSCPVQSSISDERKQRDCMKRQRMMTDYLDRAAQIESEIEPLQTELEKLRSELRDYLDTEPLKDGMKRVVKMRLLYGFSWTEISEMPNCKSCKGVYNKWLESIDSR